MASAAPQAAAAGAVMDPASLAQVVQMPPNMMAPPMHAMMAGQPQQIIPPGADQQICRYYPACRNQSSCPYKHDKENLYKVCQFFLSNNCKFGDKCRFRHALPNSGPPPSSAAATPSSDVPSSMASGSNPPEVSVKNPPTASSPYSVPPPSIDAVADNMKNMSVNGVNGHDEQQQQQQQHVAANGPPVMGAMPPGVAAAAAAAHQRFQPNAEANEFVPRYAPAPAAYGQPAFAMPFDPNTGGYAMPTPQNAMPYVLAAPPMTASGMPPHQLHQPQFPMYVNPGTIYTAAPQPAAGAAQAQDQQQADVPGYERQRQPHPPPPPPPPSTNSAAAATLSSSSSSKSWAEIVNPVAMAEITAADAESQLCPYGLQCRVLEMCEYVHGEVCDLCGQAALHPQHEEQRSLHKFTCLKSHEQAMELSFAVARSKEKTCGICMETVMDKIKGEARFGILPNCNHCFCLACIRQWRQEKQFENKIIRACPECRQTSDYICPSRYWVDTKEEKDKLLEDYKLALNKKECKYYKTEQDCPFGNKCFYRHLDAEGKEVDVGPPQRRARRSNADGELSLVQRLLIYDFLEEREGRLNLNMDYLNFLELLSDDEDDEFDITA